MRRAASLLAVGAVAAVAAAAVTDALREERRVDLSGELVYSDVACRRHAIRLPDLGRRDFLTIGCAVFTRRDNLGVKDGRVAWFAYPVPGGTTTLLAARDVPSGQRVSEVAWLHGKRFAAVLAPGGMLTIWEGSRMVRLVGRGRFRELRASPNGRYFAAVDGGAIAVFDRRGRRISLPRGRAVAWSPDERYAAVATVDEIAVVPAEGGDAVLRLDVAARDLDWRRES